MWRRCQFQWYILPKQLKIGAEVILLPIDSPSEAISNNPEVLGGKLASLSVVDMRVNKEDATEAVEWVLCWCWLILWLSSTEVVIRGAVVVTVEVEAIIIAVVAVDVVVLLVVVA
jgi:hypothetical protein